GGHQRVAIRIERAGVRAFVVAPQLVVAVAGFPQAIDAPHAFDVRTAALARPELVERGIERVDVQAVAILPEVFTAQLDAAVLGVAARRPLPRRIGDPQRFIAAEAILGTIGL